VEWRDVFLKLSSLNLMPIWFMKCGYEHKYNISNVEKWI
jgi:hypothetical protein